MEEHNKNHFIFWSCVFVSSALVFAGWLFSVRFTMSKITADYQENMQTAGTIDDVQNLFSGIGDVIKNSEEMVAREKDSEIKAELDELRKATAELNQKIDKIPNAIPVEVKKDAVAPVAQ